MNINYSKFTIFYLNAEGIYSETSPYGHLSVMDS